ncbi:DUF3313 domain-containing protein [Neisseriaceae bacterium JH1-16]|nr:DUF3313 domain-containing protein [Neisseriaceae bacterium JH1-16]
MKPYVPMALAALLAGLATPLALAAAPDALLALPKEAFQHSPSEPHTYRYQKPGSDLRRYRQILIAPLAFLSKAPSGDWKFSVADERNKISQYFQQSLKTQLQQRGIETVEVPGPDALRLQVAVTTVTEEKPGLKPIDILPVKAVFNLARNAAGLEPYLVKISTLGQLEDSQSGELLAGAIDLKQADKAKSGKGPLTLDYIETMIDKWNSQTADRLAKALQPAQQAAPSASAPTN